MSRTIQKELLIPQPREHVWNAITSSATLAQWMYPNDFEPRIGHRFTFRVPPNPTVKFDGLTVQCEVLECDPPSRLAFTWSVPGPVENSRVSFRLEPEQTSTRLFFEHAGFDFSKPRAEQAFTGAGYGWTRMLDTLFALFSKPEI